jgi:restriction endonuclease S subunit
MDRNIGEELIQSARNGQIGNLIEILDKNAGIVNYANSVVLILSQYLIILCINSFFYFYIYFIRMVEQLFILQHIMVTHQP